jgi:hypothetical protein
LCAIELKFKHVFVIICFSSCAWWKILWLCNVCARDNNWTCKSTNNGCVYFEKKSKHQDIWHFPNCHLNICFYILISNWIQEHFHIEHKIMELETQWKFDFLKALINSFLAYHATKKNNNFSSKMTNLLEFNFKFISFNLITTHVKCSKSCWHDVLLCTLTSPTNVFKQNICCMFHVICTLCLLHAKRHI